MKKSKKISVLISLVLILLLAIGAASAADEAGITDDADLASVDEVQTVDNTQTTDEIYTEPTDIVVTDTGDSGDLDDAEEDVISDTGQKDDSDDGDEAVVSDASSPKNALKAVTDPDEPLGAPDGTFRDLYNLINNAASGSTITLDRNYVYTPGTDNNYRNGILVNKTLTINGNGFSIDGQGTARGLILGGYTTSNWVGALTYHGYTYNINNINFVNLTTTAAAGAAIASHTYPNTVRISNCNFTNNNGGRGAVSISVQNPTAIIGPFVDEGSVTITGSVFKDNHASANSNGGGAIYVGINADRSSLTLRNNVFVNNTAAANAAQVIYYANANYIDINYNWWGQNTWNNNFVANSNTNYMTPTNYYRATLSQTGSNTVKVTMGLNAGTAPSGSTLPARNATFSIESGAIESTGPLTADFVASQDTTITATVDNQPLTLIVYKSPKWDINELEVIGTSVDLPNQPTIIVNSDVDGIYNITIGSYTNTVNVENGQGILTLEGFGEGGYVVIVSRTNDPIYNDKFASGTFSIDKQTVIIDIEASDDDITYGENVTIIPHVISHDFDESAIQYYVDGHIVANSTLSGLSVGTHNVIAKFDGNATHKAAESNRIEINVDKAPVSLRVDDVTVPYGQAGTVTIHTNVPGYYTVTVGNLDPIVVKVTGETKDVTISDFLPTGTYELTVSFDGDENHYARTYPASYVVGRDSIHASVSPLNPTYPDAGQVVVSSNVDGTYIVTINEKDYEVVVENGQGTVDIDKLGAGDYVISLSAEIETYDPIEIENAGTYTVKQGEVEFSITPKDAEVIYGDVANVTALITEGATGTITYYVDGVVQAPVEVSGEYGVRNLSAGTHTIFAKYSGDDNYYAAESNTIEITVSQAVPIIYVIPTNVTYPNNPTVVVAVYNSRGMVGLNIPVKVTINGVTYALDAIEGGNYLTIEGLEVGEYPITAVTVANENYGSATNNTEKIVVNKGDLTITAGTSASSVAYGDEISFTNTITAPEGAVTAGTVKYFVDGTEISGDSISTLEIGEHTVVAEYSGDTNFNAVNSTAVSFTVTKANPTLIISANATEIQYLDNIKLSYTLTPEGATGSVVYYLNGNPVDGDVLRLLEPGTYTVTAKYEGNDNYNEVDSSNSLSINVGKRDVSVEVNSNYYTIEYGEAILLTASVDPFRATGHITYIVDGVEGDQYYFEDLSVGTHSIAARFNENVFYNGALSQTKFVTVTKATPELTVTANPIVYGQDATITIGLDGVNDEKITGVVKVTINGKIYDVAVSNGVGTLTVSGLAPREDGYPISAEFAGNDRYKSANNYSTKQVVNKAQPVIGVTPVEISYGEDAVINITLEDPIGEKLDGVTVYATVDGEEHPVTINNGVGTLTISGLLVDKYDIMVEFQGNDNYSSAETTRYDYIVVKKATVDVTVGNVVVLYPTGGKIVITASAPGEYIVKVGEEEYEVTVDLAGVPVEVQVADSLQVGPYDVKVTADETENHQALDVTFAAAYIVNKGNLTVVATPNATEITYGEEIKLNHSIIVPDGGLLNGMITYLIDGEYAETVVSGLSAGTHTFTVLYSGDPNFNDVESAPETITVNKAKPVINVAGSTVTYPANGTVLLTVSKANGDPLPGVTVYVTVNDVDYVLVTNNGGVASLSIQGLDAGEYPISAVTVATDDYASASYIGNAKVVIKKITPYVDIPNSYVVNYPDTGYMGIKASVPGTYIVKVGTEEIPVVITETDTIVIFNITKVFDPGRYDVSVTADLGKNYEPVDTGAIATYTVNTGNIIVTAEDTVVDYPGRGDFYITTNVEGEYIIRIGSKTFSKTLVPGRNWLYVPDELVVGSYDVIVSVSVPNYNPVENKIIATYKVVPAEIKLSCENVTAYYPDRALFDLFATVDADYVITIAGSDYEVTVVDGHALVYPHTWIPVGVHNVTVTADYSPNYIPLVNVTIGTYTVLPAEVALTVLPNVTEIAYGDTISLDYSADMTLDDQYISYIVDGRPIEGNVVSGLSVGTHTVAVKYSGDPNIDDMESAPVTITVNKAKPVINVVGSESTYPADGTVLLTVANANGDYLPGITVIVTVNGVDYAVVTNEVGAATLTIKGLDAGEYPISAVTVATDNYASVAYSGNDKVVIKKITPIVEIPNSVVVTYPDTALMGIVASVPGTYTVKVGTEEIPVVITEADTVVLFNISKVLDAGKYNVSVTADLGSNYEPVDTGTIATYTVNNATIRVTAEDTVVQYPGRGEMYITVNAEGEYTIKIGDKTYTKFFYPGENWLYVGDEFALGTYDVLVSANIDNYNAVQDQKIATYTVDQAEIKVYSDNITVYYPYNGIITIFSNMDGDYLVSINGTEYPVVTVTNGKGYVYTHTWIPLGVHDVLVTADFGENYKPLVNATIGTYTVLKSIMDIYVVPNVTSIVYGDTISLDYDVDGHYIDENCLTYLVDGRDIEGNIVSGLSVGTHTVAVRYSGDPGIEDVVSPPVTITVSKAAPLIEVTAINSTYPQAAGVTIAVKNDEGTLISGVTVKVTVNGVDYAVETDNTGQAVLTINGLAAGEYPITAVSIANDNYGSATNATEKLEVKAADLSIVVKPNATDIKYGESISLDNVITAPEGTDVAGTVIYYVDGEAIVGNVVPAEQLTVGTHTVVAKYLDDPNFNDAESDPVSITVGKGIINISALNVTVTYPSSDFIRITTDVEGDYTIYLGNIDIFDLHFHVGENWVNVDPGIFVGEYPIRVSANIDDYEELDNKLIGTYTVNQFEVSLSISANATDITYGDTVSISYEADPDILLEEDIIYYVDGVEYPSATLTGLTPGTHTVVAKYAGDENYKAAESNVLNITVSKATPVLEVIGTTVEYGTPATVKIIVSDDGLPITTGSVIVTVDWLVDGQTVVVELEEGSGEATFTLTGVAPGTFDITATYIANDYYNSVVNDTEKIIVTDSSDLTLEVSANEVTVGEDTILTVTATDGSGAEVDIAKVNVTIGDETKEYPVVDGKVNLGPLPVGTTEILVTYEDEFYDKVQDTVEAKVNKAAADVTVTPGNGTVNITAKDKETGEPISGTATVVIDGGEPINVTVGEDGTIEYPIDAAPGPHTVEVTFTNDDYEPVTKTVTVVVPKAETTLTIATEDTPTYGDNVTVTATITEGATGTITYYVDGSTVGTELAIGEDFVVSGLSAGEHNITAKYAGNDNYSAAESNVLKFTVAKAELVITIDSAQTYYPNTGTVNVSANNDGVYTITVNGNDYTVTISGGKGSFEVTEVLPVAEYPITWDIAESENYTGATGSAVYEVLNTEPDFSITGSSEINYGQNNTIVPTINEDATGTITYFINGQEVATLDVKEKFVTDVLNVGPYTVTATYSGDVNYGSKTDTFEFDVLPIDVVVSVASDEVYYPHTGFVNLTASALGTYTVWVGNKSYDVEVTEAGVPITVEVEDIFEVGKYEINVTARASPNYNALDTGAIGTYVVSKDKSIITVSYDNATGKATVTLEGAEGHVPLSESISFEIDGEEISGVETTDGVYVSEDLALAPGKHSIFVVFVGNDNYLGAYDQIAFEVDKFATAEVTVSADPIKEGEDAIINIAVKDSETGAGLSGVVTVKLDGTDYAVDVTDGIGTLTVKNLVATTTPTTEYPITAKFNGNDEYAEATGTGTIEVTDYNDVIIVISGGDENAQATLIDSDLNPINGKVNVTVDGKDPVELDVVDGKVIIPVDDIGDHDITVEFLGDDTHKPASESATVFVGKKLIPTNMVLTVSDITYTENEEVVVVLKDENGFSISGKVNLTIGDRVEEVTVTGGQGQITISGLDAGTKTVIGEFVSDGTYAGTVVSTTFTVKQMKTRIVANNMTTTAINVSDDGRIGKWLTMTLVDANGKALANKKVSFGFNAKVYNRTTDANGKASLQINLQKAGDYTFAISFLGDKNYEGAFEVVKVTVNKQKASMTTSGATYKASAKTKTLTATLKSVAGNPMPDKKVTFTVNGKTYSAMTDSKGVAKVNVSLTKAGSYSVEVKFTGTSTYEPITRKVTLKLT